MNVNRRLGWVVLGLMLCAMAWVIWPGRSEQTRMLSDGSELTLRLVTFDQAHREPIGDRWMDRVGRWLPQKIAQRLGSQFVTAGGTNELRFWLVRSRSLTGLASKFRAVTVDSHGCELGLSSITAFPLGQRQQTLWTVGFSVFPRREPEVLLRILEPGTNGSWVVDAEFVVPNPDTRRHPTWPVPSLPQTNRLGDVDLVLMEAGASVVGGQIPPKVWRSGESPGVYVRFGVYQHGKRSSLWEVDHPEGVSDATGQVAGGRGYAWTTTTAGDAYYVTDGGLCLDESAWNLTVTAVTGAEFSPRTRWEISAVPVPAVANSNSVVDVVTNLHGAALQFHGVVGPKSTVPKARRMLSDEYLVHVSCPDLPADIRLDLQSVTDVHGTRLRVVGQGNQGPDYFFAVKIPAEAKTLNVAFDLTRRVRLEYRFRPNRIDTDGVRRLAQEVERH